MEGLHISYSPFKIHWILDCLNKKKGGGIEPEAYLYIINLITDIYFLKICIIVNVQKKLKYPNLNRIKKHTSNYQRSKQQDNPSVSYHSGVGSFT